MQISHAVSRLIGYASKHKLFGMDDRVLLAVSGGLDSMCMLALFEQTDQPIGVAHMNFQLRGTESDRDAAHVENYCKERGIVVYVKRVDCREYMTSHGVGVQEAARDLRYAWMLALQNEKDYQVIATAHHQDDSVETFLINLMRGTGIRGLTGIPVKRTSIIRPMMCFDSQEIQSIVKDQNIEFCQDSSNDNDDYLRNRIRHHLIPLMNDIKTGSSQNMIHNIERIKGQWESLEALSECTLSDLSCTLNDNGGSLRIDKIKAFPSSEYVLTRLVIRYGFTVSQCASILQSNKSAGIGVFSSTHEMILDRELIRINKKSAIRNGIVQINIDETASFHTGRLEMRLSKYPERFSTDPNIEYIDGRKLQSTLAIRGWVPGDRFTPIGMNGSQKVSDLLTNLKLSSFEKRNVKVLIDGEYIVWVIGVRLSDNYKVDKQSKGVIQLIWTPSTEASLP